MVGVFRFRSRRRFRNSGGDSSGNRAKIPGQSNVSKVREANGWRAQYGGIHSLSHGEAGMEPHES